MNTKVEKIEALLKKAMELALEVQDDEAMAKMEAKAAYRSLRGSDDEKAEDKAYEDYSKHRLYEVEAKNLYDSLIGLCKHNELFR